MRPPRVSHKRLKESFIFLSGDFLIRKRKFSFLRFYGFACCFRTGCSDDFCRTRLCPDNLYTSDPLDAHQNGNYFRQSLRFNMVGIQRNDSILNMERRRGCTKLPFQNSGTISLNKTVFT
ncbi:MAG: hypothetical protein AMK71_08615 [Nitrospira bacterium SG8_35_4]|nr:MAG: hypothetical protein AMK71_08615 [Nitrospira bacterium SG8_35_4]